MTSYAQRWQRCHRPALSSLTDAEASLPICTIYQALKANQVVISLRNRVMSSWLRSGLFLLYHLGSLAAVSSKWIGTV